ncbi:MAG: response regulator [Methylococcaceae bacterium]|nr:response regulator [Methylococcaceae bacterium]
MNYRQAEKHVNTILMADDDSDDRLLVKEALNDANFPVANLCFVEDGDALMDYLLSRINSSAENKMPLPDLILLDLNMPKKDGREALKEIKSNADLRRIPVVVFTTSTSPQDIKASYDCGANSYISKSATFDSLAAAMQTIKSYWVDYALVS